MNENEAIQAYLRSLGVDPGLFGTYGANQLTALQQYDAGTGDYASWDWRNVPFAQAMGALQADPTNNQYTFAVDRFSTKGDNYGVQIDPATGGFGLRVKVGDKDSVEVPYKQQPDGSWAPDWQAAKAASWDTNAGAKRDIRGMATVLGAAAGGYLANSAGLFDGITNAMNGAFPGVAGAAEGAATVAPAGLTASSPEVLSGLYGAAGEPLVGGLTLAEAGAAGAIPGVIGTAAPAAGGGLFEGIMEMLPSGVKEAAGALPWEDILKGGAGAIIGRNQDRQARIGDQNYRDLETTNAANLFNAANTYAGGLTNLANQYKGAYDPFYAQVDNGVATSNIDPVTGKVSYTLNAPYAEQRNRMFGAAGDVYGQMKDFNPQTFATERYNAAQNLLKPGDTLAEQNLLQQLFDKGGFGLTTNTPAAATPLPGGGVAPGQGSVGINPYVNTFANARNQRNAEMSYRSLNEGESYLDNLIRRQTGLFGQGAGIDAAGAGVMRDAFSASNQFMGDRRTAAGFGYNAGREALQIPYNAQREYLNAVTGANQRFMGNQAVADATKGNNYWDVAQKLPWGDIWGKVSGWLF